MLKKDNFLLLIVVAVIIVVVSVLPLGCNTTAVSDALAARQQHRKTTSTTKMLSPYRHPPTTSRPKPIKGFNLRTTTTNSNRNWRSKGLLTTKRKKTTLSATTTRSPKLLKKTSSPKDDEVSTEHLLFRKLLGPKARYQKQVRPVKYHNAPILVHVGMCVMMIEEILERDQVMIMSACIKLKWIDYYLRWDPSEFQNLTWISVSSKNIWIPDVAIINSPESYQITRKETMIDLNYLGEIGYYPSGKLVTRCNLRIKYFPLDWQQCEVRLESWIYSTTHLQLEMYSEDAVDIKEYYTNHEWAIIGYDILPEVAAYDGKNFSSVTFVYILRRKPIYYVTYFIFPQFLLALMQTLSSTLPVEHPGRMAMLTSLFIGTSVTQAGIADIIPKASDSMSLLQIYMSIMSCNIVISLIITCVMMYSVLRYPNEEPSITAMFIAFFSIVWPAKQQVGRGVAEAMMTQATKIITPSIGSVEQAQASSHEDNHSPTGPEDIIVANSSTQPNFDLTTKRKIFAGKAVRTAQSETIDGGRKRDSPSDMRRSLPAHDYNSPLKSTPFWRKRDIMTPSEIDVLLEDPASQSIPELLVSCDEPQSLLEQKLSPATLLVTKPNTLHLPPQRQSTSFYASQDLMANGFVTINPNVETPAEITHRKRRRNQSGGQQSPNSPRETPSSAAGETAGAGNTNKKERRKKRGEASACDETRDLKRRWLIYCVAIDKSVMYVMLMWNILVPVFLFIILPSLSPNPVGSR